MLELLCHFIEKFIG